MSLARSLPSRSFRQLRLPFSNVRSSGLRQGQRVARRNYAGATETVKKGAEKAKEGLSSELPWLLTAIGVTIPGTYLILNSGADLHNPLSYPLPGSHHHGHEEHEEHEEEEEKEAGEEGDEKAEESQGDEEQPAEGEDEKHDQEEEKEKETGEDDDSSSSEAPKAKEGKTLSEVPDDNSISKNTKSGEPGKFDEETQLEDDDKGNKVIHKPDAKGGAKRRIESANSEKMGTDDGGITSDKQAGLSNTDTKHSTNLEQDSGHSTKGDGSVETSKSQGTIDPARPQK